ncbi:hypothetical protein [Flavobacterium crocinum]|nr:hypothetical protein [Flavobacterium crocinum]
MKKLITVLFLSAVLPTVQGQAKKPTKEETIQFIQKTVSNAGRDLEFQINDTKVSWKNIEPSIGLNYNREFTNVRFEKLLEVYQSSLSSGENSNVRIKFSVNTIKYHLTGTFYDEIKDLTIDDKDGFTIVVPREKVQSIIKAFDRLKEITIEENKDPFQN